MLAIFRLFGLTFLRQWVLWFFVGLLILLAVLSHQGQLFPSARFLTAGLAFVVFISLALIQSLSTWLRPSWLMLVLVRPRPRWQFLLFLQSSAALAVGLFGLTLWTPSGPLPPLFLLPTISFGFALAAWMLLGLLLLPHPVLVAVPAIAYTFIHTWLNVQATRGIFWAHLLNMLLPSPTTLLLNIRAPLPLETLLRFCLEEVGSGLLAFLGVVLLLRRRDIAHLSDPDT